MLIFVATMLYLFVFEPDTPLNVEHDERYLELMSKSPLTEEEFIELKQLKIEAQKNVENRYRKYLEDIK